jgi:hypothetical protein
MLLETVKKFLAFVDDLRQLSPSKTAIVCKLALVSPETKISLSVEAKKLLKN